MVVNIGQKTRPTIILGQVKTKKEQKKKNDSHRFAYNENDYDYANAVNIDNFSTFSFKWIWEPWMGFLVGEEVEEEINVIRTKTKIRWRIGLFRVKKGFTNAYTLLAQSRLVLNEYSNNHSSHNCFSIYDLLFRLWQLSF